MGREDGKTILKNSKKYFEPSKKNLHESVANRRSYGFLTIQLPFKYFFLLEKMREDYNYFLIIFIIIYDFLKIFSVIFGNF